MMRSLLLVFFFASASPTVGQATIDPYDVVVSTTTSSGDQNIIRDFESVQVAQFILGQIKVEHKDVNLLCSKRWPGVIAYYNQTFFTINERAARDLAVGKLQLLGEAQEAVPFDSARSPFSADPKSVQRLSDRASRQCGHPTESEQNIAREKKAVIVAKAKPRNTKQENVLNHIAEVMVIDELCDRLEINTVFLSMAATYNGVSGRDIASGGKYHDKLVSLVRIKRSEMLNIGADEDLVCASGELLYGPSGINVKGLLTSSY